MKQWRQSWSNSITTKPGRMSSSSPSEVTQATAAGYWRKRSIMTSLSRSIIAYPADAWPSLSLFTQLAGVGCPICNIRAVFPQPNQRDPGRGRRVTNPGNIRAVFPQPNQPQVEQLARGQTRAPGLGCRKAEEH